jgi:hypothetical protein
MLWVYLHNHPRVVEQDRLRYRVAISKEEITTFFTNNPNFSQEKKYRLHGPTAIASWREKVAFASMQATLHEIVTQQGCVYYELEFDYDYGNPRWGDAISLIIHGYEYMHNRILKLGKTDPFVIRKWLNKRGYEIPLVNNEDTN